MYLMFKYSGSALPQTVCHYCNGRSANAVQVNSSGSLLACDNHTKTANSPSAALLNGKEVVHIITTVSRWVKDPYCIQKFCSVQQHVNRNGDLKGFRSKWCWPNFDGRTIRQLLRRNGPYRTSDEAHVAVPSATECRTSGRWERNSGL
jgi:hypothetical protein